MTIVPVGDEWDRDPLAWLMGQRIASRFVEEIFERDYVIASAAAEGLATDRFNGIMSIAEVDRLVTSTDLKGADLLLADASREEGVPANEYTDDQDYVDRGAVVTGYRRGATIVLNQAQRRVPNLGRLCQGLEVALSAHIQTNIYLTPPDAQGFPTHFDNHDVFVIQAEGSKRWRLYNVPLDIPYRGERYQSSIHERGELAHEFVMHPGDVCYVPRGMMHDAVNEGDGPSLHITVGIINQTWADLILEAVSEVALRHDGFRRSLPPGFARDDFDRTAARATLAELGQVLATEMRLDPTLDMMADNFVRTRAAVNPGMIVDALRPIGATERFRRASHTPIRMQREEGDDGRWVLMVPGSRLWFTSESGAALERAMDGTPFTLADLDFEHDEALVRRLLSYALIEPARQ
jgi:lysine-specific demethylase/histidyl-hydroxylase NO66